VSPVPGDDEPTRWSGPVARTGSDRLAPDLPTDPGRAYADTPHHYDGPAGGSDGVVVPGYEVRAELARGGMGVVYAADDPSFGRAVAVKVLLPAFRASPDVVGRFGTEARITGRLQHPGIPPAHAVGTLPDGRPYLVMKLIRGRTLAALLEDRPDPAADLARFVRVFEQVCEAVGYAHGRGVIHRDLKPSNVMVGAFGEVQVMDWGLAKDLRAGAAGGGDDAPGADPVRIPRAEAHTPPPDGTAAGAVLGTPAYMAPEQARGDIDRVDARADVFALGGILCAILTGQPPFTGTGPYAVVCARAGQLDDAFARLDGCGADPGLVGLAKRCLAADPADRPADGGAAAGLVVAYRTAVEDRLRAAERDRAAAEARAAGLRAKRRWQAVAGGVVGLLVMGTGAAAWRLDRQAAAQADAAFRQQVEDDRRGAAEKERAARNDQRIEGLLAQADAALRTDDPGAAAGALDQAAARFGEGGSDHLRPRFARAAADMEVIRELDKIAVHRWSARGGRFQTTEAVARIPGVVGKLGVDLASTPPAATAARVGESAARDRVVAALDEWFVRERSAAGRALLRAVDPDPFRDEVRDAFWAIDPAAIRNLTARPDALVQPPGFAAVLGQLEVVSADRRGEILRAAHRRRPADLTVLMTLGELYPSGQKEGAAERVGWYRAAVAARPGNPSAWNNLGIALRDAGAAREAIEAFRQAGRADPAYTPAIGNLGTTLCDTGDTDGAVALFREAVRLDPDRAEYRFNLGNALAYRKDFTGAVVSLREAARLAPDEPQYRFNLGTTLEEAGDRTGAIAAFREAIRLNPGYAKAHDSLGLVLRAAGDLNGAAAAFRETTRLLPDFAPAHYNLGNTLVAAGDFDAAAAAYRAALRADPTFARAAYNVGVILAARGDPAGARGYYQEAARLDPQQYGHLLGKLPPPATAPPPRPVGPPR